MMLCAVLSSSFSSRVKATVFLRPSSQAQLHPPSHSWPQEYLTVRPWLSVQVNVVTRPLTQCQLGLAPAPSDPQEDKWNRYLMDGWKYDHLSAVTQSKHSSASCLDMPAILRVFLVLPPAVSLSHLRAPWPRGSLTLNRPGQARTGQDGVGTGQDGTGQGWDRLQSKDSMTSASLQPPPADSQRLQELSGTHASVCCQCVMSNQAWVSRSVVASDVKWDGPGPEETIKLQCHLRSDTTQLWIIKDLVEKLLPRATRNDTARAQQTCPTREHKMKMSAAEISEVLKEGELEKRSDSLLQFWKRKTCVLTTDSLNIYPDTQKRTRGKELKLQAIKKVDCVERTGKFVYFTIVTTDNKEIDFRCPGEENCWNAVITMALIDFQNRKAIQDFKTLQDNESASPGQQERRMARAP
ncbi:unnamed protein product [Pleuronectes platessa]|uniref:Pleckstrin homology-like domain family A member 2 n=2 Tax=Pleuronectes platessa TaxID=8262 RepID=A0A9N7TU61_PLEPL|nr:unnamed protein product [Pleuronectes platessa]